MDYDTAKMMADIIFRTFRSKIIPGIISSTSPTKNDITYNSMLIFGILVARKRKHQN